MSNCIEFYPTAKIIADSLNVVTSDRLTTMVIVCHRYIWAEILTHRSLSRNAQSSRAFPISKMIDKVIEDNVYPMHWGKNRKGMQATEEVSAQEREQSKLVWNTARMNATTAASLLNELGVHKQVVNRVLEPFSTITAIISATDWDNFFKQRCHIDAQPEIRILANEMFVAYANSNPLELYEGDWHLPLLNMQDFEEEPFNISRQLEISVGRCARVSYLNHEGVRNLSEDVVLHDRLLASEPKHLSPFEHQALVQPKSEYFANFKGFKQYRRFIEEGRTFHG